jgi:hypothetical protein
MMKECGHCRDIWGNVERMAVPTLEGSPVCRHCIVWDASDVNEKLIYFYLGDFKFGMRFLCGVGL